jgi:hypothetical protein
MMKLVQLLMKRARDTDRQRSSQTSKIAKFVAYRIEFVAYGIEFVAHGFHIPQIKFHVPQIHLYVPQNFTAHEFMYHKWRRATKTMYLTNIYLWDL